ncbi:cytochrome c oxidase subunit 3 [Neolewinella litorea]|uniref:Cytochrome oxidase subunit III n=1 Tax=Neolewinella litorea TaxID=2562452 RepID=A0A4S4NTF8_9BACT|nr:cytochrome c oxidase subunit 3 [Neolewinella litorea]THH41748.1 cytochrome oxidase subunit III [Neolewinella litorea]
MTEERDTDIIIAEDHKPELANDWSGGDRKPFRTSYGKLMMWYFLLSDAFTFAGFLISYGALRFSSPSWPVPDKVFATAPFGIHHLFPNDEAPLIFVTFMSFLLIISSGTMVRAVQEGARENKRGVVFWMLLTVLGGAGFLGCQAWEWTNLITKENMTVTTNPFGTYVDNGYYLDPETGEITDEEVVEGETYLLHVAGQSHGEEAAAGNHDGEAGDHFEYSTIPGDYPGYVVDGARPDGTGDPTAKPFIHRKYVVVDEETNEQILKIQEFGPTAFGALFFGITGFHGFHVATGVIFLLIILINAASGVYVARMNGYEMVEKIGLYWHFVDLVWVFVFLVFYLL